MEIERKFLIDWDQINALHLPLVRQAQSWQGYLSAATPVVRIRTRQFSDGDTDYILCIKGKGKLARQEIEKELTEQEFEALKSLLPIPMIFKDYRVFELEDGHLLECSLVISEVTEETPPNEADQIRDFESNLEDILQERRADWRLTEVSILQSCMLLEYKSTTRLGSQFLQIDYDGGLEVRFRMAPTVFGHPATYDLKVTERTPGENGESRWFVCLTEDLHYVHRSIWFDGEGEDGRISLDVTECCGY